LRKKYFDIVPKIIDTSLWKNFKNLDLADTFKLIGDDSITKEFRVALLERYVTTLTAGVKEDESSEFTQAVFKQIIEQRKYLSTVQKHNIAMAIADLEKDPAPYIETLSSLDDYADYVTEKLILTYIKQITGGNAEHSYELLKKFNKTILDGGLVVDLLSNIMDKLRDLNAADVAYSQEKAGFAKAITPFMQQYQKAASDLQDTFDALADQLILSESNSPESADKLPFIKALWYIRNKTSPTRRTNISSSAANFITVAEPGEIRELIGYWTLESAQRLIDEMLSALYVKMLQDSELAAYIYDKSTDATKDAILTYIIDNSAFETTVDSEFLERIITKDNKQQLIEAAERRYLTRSEIKPGYINFINSQTNRNDTQEIKNLTSKILRELLTSENPAAISESLRLAEESKTITVSDKRVMAIDALSKLKQKVLSESAGDELVIEFIASVFGKLQSSPQQDFIFLVFNILNEVTSPQLVDVALRVLANLKPSYQVYSKDYEDTYTRLQTWSNTTSRNPVIQTLLRTTDSERNEPERKYRQKLEGLLADQEDA
jgi:hypothetical protein